MSPRRREFETNLVLEKAMDLFWTNGYKATSVSDLLACMGISRQSMYNTFKSKRKLYLEVLDYYENNIVNKLFETLEAPEADLNAIKKFYEELLRLLYNNDIKRGCLIIRATTDFATNDEEIEKKVKSYYEHLNSAFFNSLSVAYRKGQLTYGQEPRALARVLTVNTVGLIVLSQTGISKRGLNSILKAYLKEMFSNGYLD